MGSEEEEQCFSQAQGHDRTSQRVVKVWLKIDVAKHPAVECHNDQLWEDR